jgi:hypothetical protein
MVRMRRGGMRMGGMVPDPSGDAIIVGGGGGFMTMEAGRGASAPAPKGGCRLVTSVRQRSRAVA